MAVMEPPQRSAAVPEGARRLEWEPAPSMGAFLRHPASALSVLSLVALGAGGVLHLAGMGAAGDRVWMAGGAVGAAYALWEMLRSLWRRHLGIDAVALLALLGALAVGEYLAAAVISLMLGSGRTLEAWAAGRARSDLRALLERTPKTAHRRRGSTLETVDLKSVTPGDVLVVATGEVVGVDGVLLSAAVLDESALTGESLPVEAAMGDSVRSGAVNAGGPFDMRATTVAAESTYAGIVRLVEQADSSRAPFVRLADRFALWFLLVTLAAAGIAWAASGAVRAVAVLVVATPCPLILAAPVALVSGISLAARRGVVVKGGGVLERLARCTTLILDKTGTLTSGHPALSAVFTSGAIPQETLLCMAGSLDQLSPHVLARAIVRAAQERGCELVLPEAVEEVFGRGIRGTVAGHHVALGKATWVGVTGTSPWARQARRRASLDGSLTVFVGVDGVPAGVLVMDDPLRTDAARTIRSLRGGAISRIVMVTGDRQEVAEAVGSVIDVDDVLAERSPTEKVDVVRAERAHAPTIMVGDGINDAPALAAADVGVAMGARGATASSEAGDVVLSVDRIDRIGEAAALARRTRRVALQSVVAGMAMSLVAMGFAGMGLLPAVWGALLQEAIDVAVILNALRALRTPRTHLRLTEEDAALSRRFRREHTRIHLDVERLKGAADSLGVVDPGEAMARVRLAYHLLVEEVEPHEAAEEEALYPAMNRVLGGTDATGTMSRAHVEIAHQIHRLGRLLDDVGPEGPDPADIIEMRRLLYGLYAILKLHTTQEEESYLSLVDDSEVREAGTAQG